MTGHLTREVLLRYMDGELSNSAMRKTARHLQACWSCQVEFGRLKEQIASILDAQTAIFEPTQPPAPKPWGRLEPRLERAMTVDSAPLWRRLLPFGRVGFAYGAVAMVLVAIAFALWVSVTPASAKEVLMRAAAADRQRFAITGKQVVRQKVRVKKTERGASAEPTVQLESWKSVESAFWKSGSDPISAELLDRYHANGLASSLPLSPPAVESWLAMAGGEPKSSRNGNLIDVQSVANAEGRARGLEEVSVRVEQPNWHMDGVTLSFMDATYEITEQETAVVAQNEVPGDVLAVLNPPASNSGSLTAKTEKQSFAIAPAPTINLEDLEMTVRFDLHRIGADLGEGIEISDAPPDHVLVDARQVSPQLKAQVVALLANMPGVQLEVATPSRGAAANVTKVIPQQAPSNTPPDQRLVMFFGNAEAQENYTRLVLETDNAVAARLYALGDLAARWPQDQQGRLSATAKGRLESMVYDHAREVLTETATLDKYLDPLLKAFDHPLNRNMVPTSGIAWQQASRTALEATQRVDRLLRSLLTTSDDPLTPDQAVPQLQQRLNDLARSVRELPTAQ
jgi:hypothetical protein